MISTANKDLANAVASILPPVLYKSLKHHPGVCVAGGFIRDVISGAEPKDVDIFAVEEKELYNFLKSAGIHDWEEKKNSLNVIVGSSGASEGIQVQFVTRVFYPSHETLILSFDFTICQACLFWDVDQWVLKYVPSFMLDLSAGRLVYNSPHRDQDAGGSLLRLIKFTKRGYQASEETVAAVMARYLKDMEFVSEEEAEEEVKNKVWTSFRRVGYRWRPSEEAF